MGIIIRGAPFMSVLPVGMANFKSGLILSDKPTIAIIVVDIEHFEPFFFQYITQPNRYIYILLVNNKWFRCVHENCEKVVEIC